MHKTEQINARIDPNTKAAAEAVFSKIGMSAAEAIRLFYRQVELHQGLPFELKIPNQETQNAMRDLDEGRNLTEYDLESFKQSLGV